MLRQFLSCGFLVACSATLVACSGSSSDIIGRDPGAIDAGVVPNSQIVRLNANGDLPDVGIVTGPGSNSATVKRVVDDAGFAYQMGRVQGKNEFLGIAGIVPDSQVGSSPTVATASYSGQYNLAYADRSTFERNQSGTITLDADFTGGTLVGQSGGIGVNGTINGQSIGGTATYRGVDASLTGRIGNERAVGAFAGNTGNAALVGGFITKRQN